MIDRAVSEIEALVGTAPACRALGAYLCRRLVSSVRLRFLSRWLTSGGPPLGVPPTLLWLCAGAGALSTPFGGGPEGRARSA